MAAPETALRNRVKEVVEAAIPGVTVEDDKLPRQAGADGRLRVAVSPEEASEHFSRVIELNIRCTLQFYMPYTAEPDETIAVDPSVIEDVGQTLRQAFQGNSSGTTEDLWFLHVARISYPDDPTGNKTRLEAEITSKASNPAVHP